MNRKKEVVRTAYGGGDIPWLDTVKGLGIYLVVFGHLWYTSYFPVINKAVYSFHMPLFFLISGFVIRNEDRESIGAYIKKQTIRLFLPAFAFVIIFLPVYFLIADGINLWETVKKICFWDGLVPFNSPCWFLFVLYEAKILERLLNISSRYMWMKTAACMVSFLLGYVVYRVDIFLPFGFDRCLVGLGFMIAGLCIKEIYLRYQPIKVSWYIGLFYSIVLLLWITSGICFNSTVSMYAFELGKYWNFVLSGICGSLIFILLSYKINKSFSCFRWWAPNTIFIVCTHYFFVRVFWKITAIIGIQNTWVCDVMVIVFAVVLMCCYMPICKFINKFIPFLNGRRRKQNENREIGGNYRF